MQIGLDSYSFHLAFGRHADFSPAKPITLFDFIDRVHDLGFDGFQVDPQHVISDDPAYLDQVREKADAHGLFIEAGAMGCEENEIRRGMNRCRHWRSPILRTFIGFDRYSPEALVDKELDRAFNNLCKMVPELEQAGVVLAIENHGDVTSTELVRLVRELDSPNIGICLDVGNTLCVLEDPVQAVTRMAPFAVSTHFKDYRVSMTNDGCRIYGVALGQGVLDLPTVYRILTEKSRLRRLVIEIPVPACQDEQACLQKEAWAVQASLDYCRRKLLVSP